MNVLHMRYAIAVAENGSISKASEILRVAQPNLSRSIKELEDELKTQLFDRMPQGMVLTPDGAEFIRQARRILVQFDELEDVYKNRTLVRNRFSLSVPRAGYIADAFVNFLRAADIEPYEFIYMETNPLQAVNNIIKSDYKLGIIRHAEVYDEYIRIALKRRHINRKLISRFKFVLLISENSKLATMEKIYLKDLADYTEILYADPYVPSLASDVVMKSQVYEETRNRIVLFERGSQFELLTGNDKAFMWTSNMPKKYLDMYKLVTRECEDYIQVYKDELIYREDHKLSDLESLFINHVIASRDACHVENL